MDRRRAIASTPFLALMLMPPGCGPDRTGPSLVPSPSSGASDPSTADVVATLDPSVDPCADFYRYACGGWLARADLTASAPITSLELEHVEDLMDDLQRLVREAPPGTAVHRYYQACMDTEAVESAAPSSIAKLLALVGEAEDPAAVARTFAHLQLAGASAPIVVEVGGDPSRAEYDVLFLFQGGLALGTAEHYVDEALVAEYRAVVALTLAAAGEPEADARAAEVVALERRLASQLTPYHEQRAAFVSAPRSLTELETTAPAFPWRVYFEALGRPDIDRAVVIAPGFLAQATTLLRDTPQATRRAYLRWLALDAYSHALTRSLADAHFAFFGQRLLGQQERRPRSFTCTDDAVAALPVAVDRLWAAEHYAPEASAKANELAGLIHAALLDTLETTPWLDAATRAQARLKARAIDHRIGLTGPVSDDDAAMGDDYLLNELAASQAAQRHKLARAGRPKTSARIESVTFGAFYDGGQNEIIVPAGILQPPYFVADRPMAMNFGGIGVVIGHELTHALDDGGRHLDAHGERRDWWTEPSAKAFEARVECVERYYDGQEILPGLPTKGSQVLGEAISDLGGLHVAFAAYQQWARAHDVEPRTPTGAGLDHEELFFVAYAQQACELTTPELAAARAADSPHPAPAVRVNAALANTPEFSSAFGCEPGDAMHAEAVCEVW